MKFSLHQCIAVFWIIWSSLIFIPLLKNANRNDLGTVLGWGIVIVTLMILVVPMMLHWQLFRRWYGWTDALSECQHQALIDRNLNRYYHVSFLDGYVSRVIPYLWRLTWTFGFLTALTAILPNNTGIPIYDALLFFSTWYPMGVILLIFISCPISKLISSKRHKKKDFK